jgi:hypothetical protein
MPRAPARRAASRRQALHRRPAVSTIEDMKRCSRVIAGALALCAGLAPAAIAQPAGGWAGGSTIGGSAPALGPPARPVRPLAPDPIEQSKALSARGVPSAGPAPSIVYRLVPEQRFLVPGSPGREIVIPPYYERLQPDGSWQAPPVTGYGTRGEGPVYVPEPRQVAP